MRSCQMKNISLIVRLNRLKHFVKLALAVQYFLLSLLKKWSIKHVERSTFNGQKPDKTNRSDLAALIDSVELSGCSLICIREGSNFLLKIICLQLQ